MQRRIRDLREQLIGQGWTYLGIDGSGHPRFESPGGKAISLSATPSDWRSTRNENARLRRLGAILTHHGATKPATNGHAPERVEGMAVATPAQTAPPRKLTARQRVLIAVENAKRPLTSTDVADEIGVPVKNVAHDLTHFRRTGQIVVVGQITRGRGRALLYLGARHHLTTKQQKYAALHGSAVAVGVAPEAPKAPDAPEPSPTPDGGAEAAEAPPNVTGTTMTPAVRAALDTQGETKRRGPIVNISATDPWLDWQTEVEMRDAEIESLEARLKAAQEGGTAVGLPKEFWKGVAESLMALASAVETLGKGK